MSNSISRLFFATAIVLLICGMGFGIFMAASHDHTAAGAHAHLNLIGFVVSSVYGAFFAVTPAKATGRLPYVVWALNSLAAVVMFPSLVAVLYGYTGLEPLVAVSSLFAIVAAVIFAVILFKPARLAASA